MPPDEAMLPQVEGAVIRDDKHGYDSRDVNLKVVVIAVAILVLTVLVVAVLLHPVFSFDNQRHHLVESPLLHRPSPAYDTDAKFPLPRLQSEPARDLRRFRAEEDRLLGTYGWTDKERGLIRVPIETAIDLLLQRGLPTREASHAR